MNGGGDVGVHLDVDARVVRVGAQCVRRLGADALELEVGHCDGDGVDGGAEPSRERVGGRQRAVGKVRAVESAGRGWCGGRAWELDGRTCS